MAMAEHHIFRNRYKRRPSPPPIGRSGRQDVVTKYDWPEIIEEQVTWTQEDNRKTGDPIDEVALAAARERIKPITPGSQIRGVGIGMGTR